MSGRGLWIWIGALGIGVVVVALLVSGGSDQQQQTAETERGLQSGLAPWDPETAHLFDRLHGLGFAANQAETYHIHTHLDLSLDGKTVTVPAQIGIDQPGGTLSPVHTHDPAGIIHIEAAKPTDYTLGQFFTIWGVKHSKDSLGGYHSDATKHLRLYVNGKLYDQDWQSYVMRAHDELYLYFGPDRSDLAVPASYEFPQGL